MATDIIARAIGQSAKDKTDKITVNNNINLDTVSSTMAELSQQVGTEELTTTAQNISGAINEIKSIEAAAAGIDDAQVSSVLAWSSDKVNTELVEIKADFDSVQSQANIIEYESAPSSKATISEDVILFSGAATNKGVGILSDITPLQYGSEEPSLNNVRSFHNWSNLNAVICGKNMFDGIWELGSIDLATGAHTALSTEIRTKNYVRIRPSHYFTVSRLISNTMKIRFYDLAKKYIGAGGYDGLANLTYKYLAPDNAAFVRFVISVNDINTQFQIELGEEATEFEDYLGQSHIQGFDIVDEQQSGISGEVHGGNFDWASGILTIDRAVYTFDGSEYFYPTATQPDDITLHSFAWSELVRKKTADIKCSHYKYLYGTDQISSADTQGVYRNTSAYQIGFITTETSVTALKEFLSTCYTSGTPVQIEYELETPITVRLDNGKVYRVSDPAIVWCDTGDVHVLYVHNLEDTLSLVIDDSQPSATKTYSSQKINNLDPYSDFNLAHKLNNMVNDLREMKNYVDSSVAALTQVSNTEGTEQTVTISSIGAREKYMLRVGLHYESTRYSPSETDIFFNKSCKNDFSDVRFFDQNGRMLKAQLSPLVNLELLEDEHLDYARKVCTDGRIIGFNTNNDTGLMLLTNDGLTSTIIDGTYQIAEHESTTYHYKSMYPVFVDGDNNIYAYAGGLLYKLLASDNYTTKTVVCDFHYTKDDIDIYPDIQDYGMDMDINGVLYFGAYQDDFHVEVFRSTDGGDTFTKCFYDYGGILQHVHHIHADKYSPKVYVGVDDGNLTYKGPHIFVTEDGGETWTDITEDNNSIRGRDFYPAYFGEDYRLGGGESYIFGDATIYRSEDDQTYVPAVKGVAGVRSFADFGDDSLIIAGTQLCKGTSQNQILISTDQGRSWESIFTKQQQFGSYSGLGFRNSLNAVTIDGDTEPCVILGRSNGIGFHTMRIYRGGDHYYREAYILLENVLDAPITLTVKTGYMMPYPYSSLNGRRHSGLVYNIPLNEGAGRVVADSLGNCAVINGTGYTWESEEEPVRFGDYGGKNEPKSFMPSSALKLTQGTTLNFGQIPSLNFSKEYTVTFWLSTDARFMDEDTYTTRRNNTVALFSTGNVVFFTNYNRLGYALNTIESLGSLSLVAHSRMDAPIHALQFCRQYFFIALTVDENNQCAVYVNGACGADAVSMNVDTTVWSNFSDGDFVIGSNMLEAGGYLSDIKVYNRVIDADEILEIYKGW